MTATKSPVPPVRGRKVVRNQPFIYFFEEKRNVTAAGGASTDPFDIIRGMSDRNQKQGIDLAAGFRTIVGPMLDITCYPDTAGSTQIQIYEGHGWHNVGAPTLRLVETVLAPTGTVTEVSRRLKSRYGWVQFFPMTTGFLEYFVGIRSE